MTAPNQCEQLPSKLCDKGADCTRIQTIVSSQPYSIHRDPKVFDRPATFDPDRWLTNSKELKELMTKAFIPFSAGQRGCLGRGLAWIHMQKTLARLLDEFEGFEMTRGMTDNDMEMIERGALAKPRGTKLWVKYRVRRREERLKEGHSD